MSTTSRTSVDIILSSQKLKQLIRKKIDEFGHSFHDIAEQSKLDGVAIYKPQLSNYFNNEEPVHNGLTQKQVIYLALRYGIDLKLSIKEETYDHLKAEQLIKHFFSE